MISRYRARLAMICQSGTLSADLDDQVSLLERHWREARVAATKAREDLIELVLRADRDEQAILSAQLISAGARERQLLIVKRIAELRETSDC